MDAWQNLTARINELDAIAGALGVLEWDQQTYMPPGAAATRGQQMAVLNRIHHERFVDPQVGAWLDELAASDLDPTRRAAVRNAARRYRRATVVPARLVEELARARTEGFNAWIAAKESNDPAGFLGPLQRLIELTREQASLYPEAAHPYDALLEDYNPGSTVAELRPMFERLGRELNQLLDAIDGRPHPAGFDTALPADDLRRLSERVIADLGFDKKVGRMDLAEHPFTTGLGPGDTRLTTHLHPDNFLATLGGTTHECGHGLYEQGLPNELQGTGLNRAAGMGLHESQSRLWENYIGRSLPFFRYLVPRMQGLWPDLAVTPEQLYGAANRVERSLIRIFADEGTYNLHIIARFELEVAVLEGRLQAKDLPEAWNETYRRVVGVVAKDPRDGLLQDVHWSSGLFGYFPSYTIGNLYAASLGATLEREVPDLWAQVEAGRFETVLTWLREKIHRRGHLEDPGEIFRAAVGDRDPVEDLAAYLWRRHGALYGVTRPA